MSRHTSQSDFQRIDLTELRCIAKSEAREVDLVNSYNQFIKNTLGHLRSLIAKRSTEEPLVWMFDTSES